VRLVLDQAIETLDPVIAERIAKDCLILAPGAADLETIGKLVNTALVVDSTHKSWGDVHFVKGLAEYRQGHFASAVEWLQKVLAEKRPWTHKVQGQMVLAMAQHQLKQADEARATLAEGLQTAERNLKKLNEDLDDDWNEWIIAHQLMSQAQALIDDKPKPTNETK
jgi:tetratricopeptide (TPR) repeat protein